MNPPAMQETQVCSLGLEETMNEAYQKLGELRELDVEVPDSKFSPDDFGDVELSPVEMTIVMPFIAE